MHGSPAVMRERVRTGRWEGKRRKRRKERFDFHFYLSFGILGNDRAVVVSSPALMMFICLHFSSCPSFFFFLFFFLFHGIKIRHSESAFHLRRQPQFSSRLSSPDCFLHIQQPPRGQSRDLWCAHQRKGILSNNFATSEADLSTCLLNHCWKKVGPTLLCCSCESAEEEEEEEKTTTLELTLSI